MKKKYFYVFKSDNPNDIFWKQNKNSLYEMKNNKVYFKSKIRGIIEIDLEFIIPDLNDQFVDQLTSFIDQGIKDASILSKEPITQEPNTYDNIKSIIISCVDIAIRNENNYSIFNFITDIFIKCLMRHAFFNGNKRFSLSFIIIILRSFGYHFRWSKGIEKDYGKHEAKIEYFVCKMTDNVDENKRVDNRNKMRPEILKWIKYNCVISIP